MMEQRYSVKENSLLHLPYVEGRGLCISSIKAVSYWSTLGQV